MYLKDNNYSFKFKKDNTSYQTYYEKWFEQLFDYAVKLFTWSALPDTIPQKELEIRLMLYGMAGVTRFNDGTIRACDVNLYGITDYFDEFESFNYTSPKESGTRKIGETGVLVSNNSLRNPIYLYLHTVAAQLAHIDVSIIAASVNSRDSVVYKAMTDAQAVAVRAYRKNVYDGKLDCIVDRGFIGLTDIESPGTDRIGQLKDLMDARSNILSSFFETIGVKRATEKRERVVVDEMAANDQLLEVNLTDMLNSRQTACDQINAMFDLDISVLCNVSYTKGGTTNV